MYSALQYLEGCYLVDEVVRDALQNNDLPEISIVFALPNDEWKYYQSDDNGFATDLTPILQQSFGSSLDGKVIRVYFWTFRYNQGRGRPYNSGSKIQSIDPGQCCGN
jgi:hypothetical protein